MTSPIQDSKVTHTFPSVNSPIKFPQLPYKPAQQLPQQTVIKPAYIYKEEEKNTGVNLTVLNQKPIVNMKYGFHKESDPN